MPAPVTSWEGWYIGLNAGAAWQNATWGYDGIVESPSDRSWRPSGAKVGFIGGGQIGYNWQRGNFVYGLEADISGLTGKATAPPLFPPAGSKGNALEARISWLSTFRARAGWLVNLNTMVYATGGLAVGGVNDTLAVNGLSASGNAIKSASKTRVGWTVGGGIEYMFARNWFVGAEGLYVDLGKTTATSTVAPTKTGTFRNTAAIARLKLNYKF
jgi:outer membrane immunogenic protein